MPSSSSSGSAEPIPADVHNMFMTLAIAAGLVWMGATAQRFARYWIPWRAGSPFMFLARGLGHRVRILGVFARNHLEAVIEARAPDPPVLSAKVKLPAFLKQASVTFLEDSVEKEKAAATVEFFIDCEIPCKVTLIWGTKAAASVSSPTPHMTQGIIMGTHSLEPGMDQKIFFSIQENALVALKSNSACIVMEAEGLKPWGGGVQFVTAGVYFFPLEKTEEVSTRQKQFVAWKRDQNSDICLYEVAEVYGLEEGTGSSCVICLTDSKCCILLPCRHLCVCASCFRQIDRCPVCRSHFDSFLTPSLLS